tara:strand:- start:172 stop:828 length:657 start_codon:yes stop_codon:yes gene_type:complete
MSKIKLNSSSGGGSVSLEAPTSTTGNAAVEFKLPVADGTSGQALTTNASGQLAFSSVASGKILQVVSATKLDTASTANSSGTTHVAISGLQPQITPSATTSKVLIMINCKFSISTANGDTSLKLFRSVGGTETEIFSGTADGSRQGNIWGIADYNSTTEVIPVSSHYLDTPNTTSQITYILKWQSQAQAVYINRSGVDSNSSVYHRNSSSVIVMEVAA